MSGYHGIADDVRELDDADTAADLVAGNAAGITESATAMAKLGQAMTLAGEGLRAIETSAWTGQAADAFRARVAGKPAQWADAGSALLEISEALTHYRVVLDSAQSEAGRALHMWRGAQAETKKAVTEYNERVKVYNAAIDAGQDPGPQPVYRDPGEAGRTTAEQMLDDARRRVTDAGYACGRVISGWIAVAPAEPDWWDRLGSHIADAAGYATTSATDLVEGAWEGVKGINQIARLVNPFDPYNVTHPQAMLDNIGQLAGGLWKGVQNPQQLAAAVFDVDTWRDSPGKALGKLLPDLALGVATGGSGLAGRAATRATLNAVADTATGGLYGLGQAGIGGVRKVGTVLGHTAPDAADAARRSTGQSPAPELRPADTQSAGVFDTIGKTLGDAPDGLRKQIDDLTAWASSRTHADTTSTVGVTPTPQPPVRQPPQINRPPSAPPRPRPAEPVTPPPAHPLRPPPPPLPPLPATPPPHGTPQRYSYDADQRIPRAYEESLRFKEDMRQGFPDRAAPTERLPVQHHTPRTDSARLDTDQPDRLPQPAPAPAPLDRGTPSSPTPEPLEHSAPHDPAPEPAHTQPEPDLPRVRHIDPQMQLDVWNNAANPDIDLRGLPDGVIWRDPDDVRPLYRVESGRPMEDIFEEGLHPWNDELDDFGEYVHHNQRSGYVATTADEDLWMRHTVVDPDSMYVLEIDSPGGIDVEASRPGDLRLIAAQENEFAFPGGVARERIKGGFYVHVDPETGERTKIPGSYRANPYYEPTTN